MADRILIAEYDSRWPELFEREANRIRSALLYRALRIEHVGSTSIPGLAAKPTIDLLLVVADSATESSYVPALETVAYALHIRTGPCLELNLLPQPELYFS